MSAQDLRCSKVLIVSCVTQRIECIKRSEIPVRAQAAVGVSLMGVRRDDCLVACVPFRRSATFRLTLDGERTKEISAAKVTKGRRGLKGTKVVPRGELVLVEKI